MNMEHQQYYKASTSAWHALCSSSPLLPAPFPRPPAFPSPSPAGVLQMVHYDPSSRVPLIIGGPGLQENKVYTNITSQIDLYPTMMEMSGLTAPKEAGLEGAGGDGAVGSGPASAALR